MCRNGAKCVYSDLLVGSTGFVGGNLMAKMDHYPGYFTLQGN